MKRGSRSPTNASELRRRAEERMRARTPEPQSKAATQRILEELHVHQDELQMQNDELKRVRAELEAALEQYTELFDFGPAGYLTLSADGTIRQANLAAASLLGVARSRLLNRRFALFVSTGDRVALSAFLKAVFTPPGRKSCELMLRKDGGQARFVRIEANPSAGCRECRIAFVDISERKRAEDQMRGSERFARAILDALSAHIAILDETGTIIAVNRAWRHFAEANHLIPAGVCEGASYLAVCDAVRGADAATAAAFAAAVRSITRGGQGEYSLEYPCHSPEEQRWFIARVSRFSDEGAVRVVIAHENITERKRTELAIRESEERFRAIADYTADWENWFAPDGRLLWINPAVERVTGYSVAECLAMPAFPLPLFAEEERTEISALFQEAVHGTSRGDQEFRFVHKNGTTRWGSVSWQPIYASDGTHLGHRSSVRDITDRKRAEDGLRASREQLRALATRMQAAREEERTAVARDIHDVLTQELTRLKIDLVWLRRRLAKSDRAAVPEILAARVAEMGQMADTAIQCVQRIATGLRPAVLDSLGLCAAVEWQARDFQEHTDIRCEWSIPEEEPSVDREAATAIFRILQESLTNVVRHSHATRVDVVLRQERDELVLQVRDDGFGILPEMLTSPLSIGLAGMRERTLLLGGQFEIRSDPASGTTIEARIPLRTKGEPVEGKP